MITENWYEITINALQASWEGFIGFLPKIIFSLIFFLVCWFVASLIGKLISEILKKLGLNKIFKSTGWEETLEKADLKFDPSEFIGSIFKWILVLVSLLVIVEIMDLKEFAGFLRNLLDYLPNVVIAVLILVATIIVVDILEKIIRAAVEGIKIGYGRLVSGIIKWSIWVFAILAILKQLRFEAAEWAFELIKIVFMGIVLGLALAFGLGGKEVAKEYLESLKTKIDKTKG